MKKEMIGVNAGIVWRILSERNSKTTFKELLLDTDLNPVELASAIGWLAREDKIQFELQYLNGKDKKAYVYLMLNVYF